MIFESSVISLSAFHCLKKNPTDILPLQRRLYLILFAVLFLSFSEETRPDTRLPKSHAGGQGPYLRSLDHLGRSSEAQK